MVNTDIQIFDYYKKVRTTQSIRNFKHIEEGAYYLGGVISTQAALCFF